MGNWLKGMKGRALRTSTWWGREGQRLKEIKAISSPSLPPSPPRGKGVGLGEAGP